MGQKVYAVTRAGVARKEEQRNVGTDELLTEVLDGRSIVRLSRSLPETPVQPS